MLPEPTVFLVEDDPAVRDSLKVLLESHGIVVHDFASGADFLEGYDFRAGGCLVLDVHMPAIGGLDIVDKMSAMGIAIPTVLITGRADAGIRSRAFEAGIIEVIEKPFDGTVLIETIQRAMER